MKRQAFVALLLVASVSLVPVEHASARGPAVIRVPQDAPTIQAAIDEALNFDTVLVSPGTYIESLDFLGKAVTVTSSSGPGNTLLDARSLHQSAVRFHSSEGRDSVFEGFTVKSTDASGAFHGVGVDAAGASPSIIGNVFTESAGCNGIAVSA